MNIAQVATAATAYALWGWRGLVIELWVNTIVVSLFATIAARRKPPTHLNGRQTVSKNGVLRG